MKKTYVLPEAEILRFAPAQALAATPNALYNGMLGAPYGARGSAGSDVEVTLPDNPEGGF